MSAVCLDCFVVVLYDYFRRFDVISLESAGNARVDKGITEAVDWRRVKGCTRFDERRTLVRVHDGFHV